MDPLGWHVIVRCRDNRVLAPDATTRRDYLSSVLKHGQQGGLYVHGLGDSHGHNGLMGSRDRAMEFGRRLLLSLGRLLPGNPDFEPVRMVPIRDQRHLAELVHYCLKQDRHHRTEMDPLREGTSAFDYLGLRPAGDYLRTAVRTSLPRLTAADILRHLPAKPSSSVCLSQLFEAMTSAALVDGHSNEAATVKARIAAIYAANSEPPGLVAEALQVTSRTLRRLRTREPDESLVRAIRFQMGLRQAFSATGRSPLDWPDMPGEAAH